MTQKIAICAPSHNFVGLYLRNWGTYQQSEKSLLNSNNSSTRPDNMVNFDWLPERLRSVWELEAPLQISTGFTSRFVFFICHSGCRVNFFAIPLRGFSQLVPGTLWQCMYEMWTECQLFVRYRALCQLSSAVRTWRQKRRNMWSCLQTRSLPLSEVWHVTIGVFLCYDEGHLLTLSLTITMTVIKTSENIII